MVSIRPVNQLWTKAWPGVTVPVPLDYLELYSLDLLGGLAQAIYEKWGNGGLKLIEKVFYEAGRRVAERHKIMGKAKGTDIKSVGELYVKTLFNSWLGTGIVTKATDEEYVHLIANCEYACGSKELCHAMMALDRGIVETLNPELTVVILKTVAAGDPYCENIVCKRKASRE